jgi:hypothetical protein
MGGGTGGGVDAGMGGGTGGGVDGGVGGGTGGGSACSGGGDFSTPFLPPASIQALNEDRAWLTPDAVRTADSVVTSTSLGDRDVSQALVVRNLGFNLPPNAEIRGIEVRVLRWATGSGTVIDYAAELLRPAGQPVPSAAVGTPWPSTPINRSFGGPGDLWGVSWTPEVVNSPDFGFALVVANTSASSVQASVDRILVTVHADVPGTTVGPLFATGVTSETKNGGTVAWSQPAFARTLDGNWATSSVAQNVVSQFLYFTGFVTSGMTTTGLTGIAVDVRRRAPLTSGTVGDMAVVLAPAGMPSGDNKARPTPWPQTPEVVRYGGLRDLWGLSPLNFMNGAVDVGLSVRGLTGSTTAEVDVVTLTAFFGTILNAIDSSATSLVASSEPTARGWVGLPNALQPGDAMAASSAMLRRAQLTERLTVAGFGFNVPSSATVLGVEVVVSRRALAGGALVDRSARLVLAGTPSGAERATGSAWQNTFFNQPYGGATDTFGLMLTPAAVNAPTFGFGLSVTNPSLTGVDQAQVDGVQARVFYRCP